MELFRNALLASLIVILAYILYNRLIQFLQRDKLVSSDFAHVPAFRWANGVLKIELELPADQEVILQIGQEGEFTQLDVQRLSKGINKLEYPLSDLNPGKKTCRILTSTNKLERFFTVD